MQHLTIWSIVPQGYPPCRPPIYETIYMERQAEGTDWIQSMMSSVALRSIFPIIGLSGGNSHVNSSIRQRHCRHMLEIRSSSWPSSLVSSSATSSVRDSAPIARAVPGFEGRRRLLHVLRSRFVGISGDGIQIPYHRSGIVLHSEKAQAIQRWRKQVNITLRKRTPS